jgi:hypothetical protein
MFVAVLVPHLFFGNADLAERVETHEHPPHRISCLQLSRIVSTGRADGLCVSTSEEACAYACHLTVHAMYDIFDSGFMSSKFVVYLGVLLRRSRLTWDHCMMAPIVRRQQLVPASQDEPCPLVNRGNADQRFSLHRIMHHLLSDLGRLVDDIGCRESYHWRDRFGPVPAACSEL